MLYAQNFMHLNKALDLGGQKQARDAASILEAMDCTFYCLLTDKHTVANCPFVLDVALSNMELLINVSVEQYDVWYHSTNWIWATIISQARNYNDTDYPRGQR